MRSMLSAFTRLLKTSSLLETTPDDLVVAAFVQGFAKDFDSWHIRRSYERYENGLAQKFYGSRHLDFWLVNKAGTMLFAYDRRFVGTGNKRRELVSDCRINDVHFSDETGQRIWDAYDKLHQVHTKQREERAAMKRKMEEDQKRWDLAEQLLGFTRTDSDALVPAKRLCATCEFGVEPTRIKAGKVECNACEGKSQAEHEELTVVCPKSGTMMPVTKPKTRRTPGRSAASVETLSPLPELN